MVESLAAAFEDSAVDRVEQALDSTTLFRCAGGHELIARLRAMEGDSAAQWAAAGAAASFREAGERLKAEEDSTGHAGGAG